MIVSSLVIIYYQLYVIISLNMHIFYVYIIYSYLQELFFLHNTKFIITSSNIIQL